MNRTGPISAFEFFLTADPLLGGLAEDCFEEADEMKRGHAHLPCHVADQGRGALRLTQQVFGLAKPDEYVLIQHSCQRCALTCCG